MYENTIDEPPSEMYFQSAGEVADTSMDMVIRRETGKGIVGS